MSVLSNVCVMFGCTICVRIYLYAYCLWCVYCVHACTVSMCICISDVHYHHYPQDDLFSVSSPPPCHVSVGGSTEIVDSEEDEDFTKSVRSNKRKIVIESDEECEIINDSPPASTCSAKKTKLSACSSYNKMKEELPEVIAKKSTEKPLPHPFPFPSNYRPEVELCLKSERRTKEARKQFHSSVASAIFSYKRCSNLLPRTQFMIPPPLILGTQPRKTL